MKTLVALLFFLITIGNAYCQVVVLPTPNRNWWSGPSQQTAHYLWQIQMMRAAQHYQQQYIPEPYIPPQEESITVYNPIIENGQSLQMYRLERQNGQWIAIPVISGD